MLKTCADFFVQELKKILNVVNQIVLRKQLQINVVDN